MLLGRKPGIILALSNCTTFSSTGKQNLADKMSADDHIAVRDEEPTCPRCHKIMAAGVTVCSSCGHDSKGRPATFEPYEKFWEPGWPFAKRVRVFVIGEGIGLTMLVIAAFLGELGPALVSLLIFTGMLTFMLGTFNCVGLTRNRRGRVGITKSWRVCFCPLEPVKLQLGEFDGVVSGADREADLWDWVIFLVLLPFGLVLGFIWWYVAIHSVRYFVALSKHQGAPEDYLYRGLSQEFMEEMTSTIREIAFPAVELPHSRKA
jgi:hypothetical protein